MPYRPSFRQLEYIVAVAECGHFGRAAKRCNVSQPTLSVQVSLVEASLGVELFERTSSSVRTTSIGEMFVHQARLALAAMDDLLATVAGDNDALGGLIRLGTPPSFGPYFLPTFLPPIHRDYPELKIYITEDRPAAIETQVSEGTLDCGLGPDCTEGGLSFIRLGSEQLYLGVPADHPLAGAESVLVRDLASERLLALGSGHRLLENVRHLAEASGATVIDDYAGTSLDAIRQMVSIGMGISLFPELYARAEFRNAEDVVLKPIADWTEMRHFGLYFRETTGRRRHFERLAAEARRAAATLFPL
ncbi:LysR family transcriptional regulator [Pararhizobium haloflavum]|uniref:LysR family transcriptional regulator n=1 Tax=Pararhizobium haloflavum TaxID=2037914 RepID=UPI000C19E2C0|nr:hydrogen peroxide-inducible genes activator [Pararhizobium haloflavum]